MTSHRGYRDDYKKGAGGKHGRRRDSGGRQSSAAGKKAVVKRPDRRGEQGDGHEILAGIHPVREAIKAGRRHFHRILIADASPRERIRTIVTQAKAMGIEAEILSSEALDLLCPDVRHQGVVALVSPLPLPRGETAVSKMVGTGDTAFVLILESMEDPHNLGALIRTALCAGVDHIILPRDRAASPTPAVSRASAGAMEHASIWTVTNTTTFIRSLKKMGFWVAGLDAGGAQSLFQADLTGNIALVVGGEHRGIRPLVRKECDFILSLPMTRGVTSLNASVAGGIAMYEVIRQRNYQKVE